MLSVHACFGVSVYACFGLSVHASFSYFQIGISTTNCYQFHYFLTNIKFIDCWSVL
jgi:hypothetical protein